MPKIIQASGFNPSTMYRGGGTKVGFEGGKDSNTIKAIVPGRKTQSYKTNSYQKSMGTRRAC